MAYVSDNPLFKSLNDEEEKDFRDYAKVNDWAPSDWSILHPVCREEWTTRGIAPTRECACGAHTPIDDERCCNCGEKGN